MSSGGKKQVEAGITVRAMCVDSVTERQWALIDEFLSDAERARAASFRFDRHRRDYKAAHAITRCMLTSAVEGAVRPQAWTFDIEPDGKPYVAGGLGPQFNLSHCEGLVACAISRAVEVGIDVERVNRSPPFDIIHQLAPVERSLLEALLMEQKADALFKLWTLKEAVIKATGRGLAQRLDSFGFALNPPRLIHVDETIGSATSWRFVQCELADGQYLLATAWQDDGRGISPDIRLADAEELLR